MRLFVAAVPPAEVVEHLDDFLSVRREAASYRWTDPAQWHLTLAFAEAVPEHKLDDLGDRLERAARKRRAFEVRLGGGGAFPHADRARVLVALSGVRNVVVLTTDTHAHLIGEIRTQTFAPGGPVGTGIWEVVTGPVATNTYAKEIDDVLGSSGFGAVVTGAFLKPQPPNGLGLRCAQTDTYGYAQVTVTRTTLRVAPKTASGAAVRDVTGAPCAPLVVTAR